MTIHLPGFLDALQLGKQKRSQAALQEIAKALEKYRVSEGTYPDVTTLSALSAALEPDHLESLPQTDHWGNALRYGCRRIERDGPCSDFRLVSAGSDGVFEEDEPFAYEEGEFGTTEFEGDLVFGSAGRLRGPR